MCIIDNDNDNDLYIELLNNFKMMKCNYKKGKNILDIYYSFTSPNNNAQNNQKSKNKKSKGKKVKREPKIYFDDEKLEEKDDRITFSKEIISLLLNDLEIDEIDNDKLDKLLNKVHDVVNQFQNISYTKGYKAAINNK